MYSDEVLDRIAATAPAVRLVVVLREHADRLWSQYWYARALGLDRRPLARILAWERRHPGRRRAGLPVNYLESGHYTDRVAALLTRFPAEQVLVCFFDDLQADPDGFYAGVCRHLGVDACPAPVSAGSRNAGRRPRSTTLQWLTMRRPVTWLPRWVRGRVRRANLGPVGYPALPPTVRADVRDYFADDRRRLAELLARPLPAAWDAA